MIKFIKKAVSALLASVMCIPAGVMNMSYAAETNPDGDYAVTLTECEGGFMQFSETSKAKSTASQDGYRYVTVNENGDLEEAEDDGSVYAFKKGETVEIELFPDEEYSVRSLEIRSADTGNVIVSKETADNAFSFAMPAKNVSVIAIFERKSGDRGSGDADADSDSDAASGTETEEDIEKTNLVSENDMGDTVYSKLELVDDEAAEIQDRINGLPAPDILYAILFDGEEGEAAEIEKEADSISEIYFNELSDEQRAQIDPSLLYSTLLITKASDNTSSFDTLVSDEELESLQNRIDSLKKVDEIATAEVVADEENSLVYENYEFSNNEADMLVTNNAQDNLFLEVLDLSKSVYSLSPEQLAEINAEPLDDMYRFFTLGHGETGDYGIATYAEGDGASGPTSGIYNHQYQDEYDASYFVGSTTGEDSKKLIMYCGDANVAAFSHSGVPVNFSGAQKLEENNESTWSIQMAIKILYYGYGGPGADIEGVGINTLVTDPTLSRVDAMTVEGSSCTGVDVQRYMVTHFALSYVWSGNVGNAPSTAKQYAEFVNKCDLADTPSSDEFKVYLIVPQGRYQPIFYSVSEENGFEKRDPFNIWLYKENSQIGYENTTSSLGGAEFTITYYQAKIKDDGIGETDSDSFLKSYYNVISTDKTPTASFTFETNVEQLLIDQGFPLRGPKYLSYF